MKKGKRSGSGENDAAEGSSRQNYVYILQCRDDSLYTGWTNDLEKRVAAHNAGRGAKYTRGRRPVRLVYREKCSTKEEALKREAAIKRMTAARKRELIAGAQSGADSLLPDPGVFPPPEGCGPEKVNR